MAKYDEMTTDEKIKHTLWRYDRSMISFHEMKAIMKAAQANKQTEITDKVTSLGSRKLKIAFINAKGASILLTGNA